MSDAKVEDGDIVALKLITRQIVLGRVFFGNAELQMVKPLEIIIAPDENGRMGPRLTEYGREGGLLPPMTGTVAFEHGHVMHIRELPKVLQDQYLAASSGIQVAPANAAANLKLVTP